MENKKYYHRDTNKEVHIGQIITIKRTYTSKIGLVHSKTRIVVSTNNLKILAEKGILYTKYLNVKPLEVYSDMASSLFNPRVVNNPEVKYLIVNDILRNIAKDIDSEYLDDISKSPQIYTISFTNGKIIQLNKEDIKNYRNFAAFRCIEDAKIAIEICKPLLRKMFNGKPKD